MSSELAVASPMRSSKSPLLASVFSFGYCISKPLPSPVTSPATDADTTNVTDPASPSSPLIDVSSGKNLLIFFAGPMFAPCGLSADCPPEIKLAALIANLSISVAAKASVTLKILPALTDEDNSPLKFTSFQVANVTAGAPMTSEPVANEYP